MAKINTHLKHFKNKNGCKWTKQISKDNWHECSLKLNYA